MQRYYQRRDSAIDASAILGLLALANMLNLASTLVGDLALQLSVDAHFGFLCSAIIKLVVFAIYLKVNGQESKI